jgi:hypothetical protein
MNSPTLRLSDPALYINRELSWLEFKSRVLMQAREAAHPLLERVKFLAITANNLCAPTVSMSRQVPKPTMRHSTRRYLMRHLPPHGSASLLLSEISVPTTDRANARPAGAAEHEREQPADANDEPEPEEVPATPPTEPEPVPIKDPPSPAKRGPYVVD